jgi:2-polyprenyl-3-methyl-5-hydroxy-6-metoxy-1,4-benzoquinol methylase
MHKPAPDPLTLAAVPRARLKSLARRILSFLGLNIRFAVTPGVSVLGFNVFVDDRPGPPKGRAQYALQAALHLKPATVLDVGSGGGDHARAFVEAGAQVLCVDFGTSIYARAGQRGSLEVTHVDFNRFVPARRFALVWASHVLEHQRNVGQFIEKLIECCADDGHICITLPDPHRNLWGGHLTLWSPGLLAYNIVLCGVDLSASRLIRGTNEFSILFSPKRIQLPAALSYDNGDLTLLSTFLPAGLSENVDPWRQW